MHDMRGCSGPTIVLEQLEVRGVRDREVVPLSVLVEERGRKVGGVLKDETRAMDSKRAGDVVVGEPL